MTIPYFKVKILTIFPKMFPGPLGMSLAGNSLKNNNWNLEVINIRDFGNTKHKNIDDEPFGGGNGLVMRADVLGNALDFACKNMENPQIFYPSPRGKIFSQSFAKEILNLKEIIIICGRFEGIDERIIDEYNVRQICIGDYILSGGEIAAFAILDSIIRLIPGTLANPDTLNEESFNFIDNIGTLLEYPQYTRPSRWRNRDVPEILLSGNHKLIEKWRLDESIRITKSLRPDLLKI